MLAEHAVETLNFLDDLTLSGLANAFWVADVMDGVAFGLELHTWKREGRKPEDHWREEIG